jgi:hypothetical protein
MQLVASVVLILVGLWLALFAGASGEMSIFGWIVAGLGALGLIFRAVFPRQRRLP